MKQPIAWQYTRIYVVAIVYTWRRDLRGRGPGGLIRLPDRLLAPTVMFWTRVSLLQSA